MVGAVTWTPKPSRDKLLFPSTTSSNASPVRKLNSFHCPAKDKPVRGQVEVAFREIDDTGVFVDQGRVVVFLVPGADGCFYAPVRQRNPLAQIPCPGLNPRPWKTKPWGKEPVRRPLLPGSRQP